jgi:hypothetical protein
MATKKKQKKVDQHDKHCKACGACEKFEACDHCGGCRTCGKPKVGHQQYWYGYPYYTWQPNGYCWWQGVWPAQPVTVQIPIPSGGTIENFSIPVTSTVTVGSRGNTLQLTSGDYKVNQ